MIFILLRTLFIIIFFVDYNNIRIIIYLLGQRTTTKIFIFLNVNSLQVFNNMTLNIDNYDSSGNQYYQVSIRVLVIIILMIV